MNTSVYVIFHCNEWHEYSSMRLIGVASEENFTEVMEKIREKLGYSEQDMQDYIYWELADVDDVSSMNL